MEQTQEANFISGDSHAPQESKFIFLDWLTEIQVVVGILLLVFTPVLLYVIMQAHWCISGSICGLHRRRENYSIEAILIAAKRSDKTPLEEKRIEETRDHICLFLQFASMSVLEYGTMKHSTAFAVLLALLGVFARSVFLLYQNFASLELQDQARKKKDNLVPVSVYTDLHAGNMFACTCMFVIQIMLYGYLLMSVYYGEKLVHDSVSDRMWVQYVCGSVLAGTLLGFDASFIPGECQPFWNFYKYQRGFRRKHHFARIRFLMSYTVNELFAATAHLVLPFVLMEAPENMDFVKDATCVLFIAQLDTLQVVAPEHENPLEGEELQRAQDDQDEFPGKEEKELPLLKVEIPIPGRVMKKKKRKKQGYSRGNNSRHEQQEELPPQTLPALQSSIEQMQTLPHDTTDLQLSASV